MDVSTMPTVEDLRQIIRRAFEEARGEIKDRRLRSSAGPANDITFAYQELKVLNQTDVYLAERRRHELIMYGYAPPEDLPSRESQTKSTDEEYAAAVRLMRMSGSSLFGK